MQHMHTIAWVNMTAVLQTASWKLGAWLHLDAVVWELITGHQHLSLLLFHSPLLVRIRMRV